MNNQANRRTEFSDSFRLRELANAKRDAREIDPIASTEPQSILARLLEVDEVNS